MFRLRQLCSSSLQKSKVPRWAMNHTKHVRFIGSFQSTKNKLTIQEVKEKLGDQLGAQKFYRPTEPLIYSRDKSLSLPQSQAELSPRKMKDSYDECIIPLGNSAMEREKYLNFKGAIRTGKILEDIDVFAVWLCYKHVLLHTQKPGQSAPLSIVTALVDKISLSGHTIYPDEDIKMSGHVSWVGKTSLETSMQLEQMESGEWRKLLHAYFVMVARHPDNQESAFVNPLILDSPQEEAIFRQGEANKTRRQKWSHQSLLRSAPSEQEREVLHNLFLETLDPKAHTFKVRVLPPCSLWMENAKLKNVIICHPQERNLYNKMFGGFLMRQAYELAWTLAYVHSKTRPVIVNVDDIWFRQPVEIGSLLYLHAQIVYVKDRDMQVRVHASVKDPEKGKEETTNTFHFTFTSRGDDLLPRIIPRSYHEAMLYLDGKRHYESALKTAELNSL
ncbi:acyl-coenzyme A thioesterase 9, mitochondrial-like isoform X1 [Limulus polyphemus]|uniref:Acyl-coenzyme A thioesterase 9, mitochondrial-like isoform X1 n=2 Tax=Limulus polyphemus TaxID=6850 RepID=A0ABM1BK65_LIMPO|nr:acyl-coenzyme A thioesterase 9, mitochondrial-like isoform X1 [Limulus polyphemus]